MEDESKKITIRKAKKNDCVYYNGLCIHHCYLKLCAGSGSYQPPKPKRTSNILKKVDPGDYDATAGDCVTAGSSGLDAYAWIKTLGESDGRLYPAGTYHPCLLNHFTECTDLCPQFVPKVSGKLQRPDSCLCQ